MRIVWLIVLAAVWATPVHAVEPGRPNIVFILADDLGGTDLACYGSRYYETPNIDKLASQGVRFTSHHHCQNCAPTRAALMSGQYGARTGVYTVGSIERFNWRSRPLRPVDNVEELPLDRATIADQLRAAGYATGMFGKWHLGQKKKYHPAQRGFDEALVTAGKHFDFVTDPPVDYPKGQYLADFLTDRAVDFIQRHKAEPFFLYLPHFGVHAPHNAKPELIEHFKAKPGVGGHNNPTYAAMIASVDESVGRVMQTARRTASWPTTRLSSLPVTTEESAAMSARGSRNPATSPTTPRSAAAKAACTKAEPVSPSSPAGPATSLPAPVVACRRSTWMSTRRSSNWPEPLPRRKSSMARASSS